MVVIQIKNSEENTFLFETKTTESVETLINQLVEVWNLRMKVTRLCTQARRLAEFGPSKLPAKQGIDEICESAGETIKKGQFYKSDPMGQRTGNACDPKLIQVVEKCCRDAEQCVSKLQAKMKIALTAEMINEKINNIKGATTICYPMGLPEWDPVRSELEDKPELVGQDGKAIFVAEEATLWFAGKEIFRDMKVSDKVRHERSKVIMKLQGKGAKAPAREAAVSEAERKAMMSYYFKKNEEMKKVAQNDDDDFFQSSWANPKGLKASLQGRNNGVSFKAGGIRM